MMNGEIDLFVIGAEQKCPHEQSLAHVVSATFEKMGFMEAFVCTDRDESTNILCAHLEVTAPVQAKVIFSSPQKLAWKIAEHLYGLDELSTEVVHDMMSELLNTIAGSWLSEVIPNQKFSLSIPQCCDTTQYIDDEMYEYHFKIENFGVISLGLKELTVKS